VTGERRSEPTLEEIQRLFFSAITWPTGVRDFLEQADTATRARFERLFAETPGFDRIARVDVYADAYFYRLLDALREMFPRTRVLAGDTAFHNLITDYLLACPSTAPDLRRAGDRLPAFVARHSLGNDLPFLPHVAVVEAALNHALDCRDDELLSESDLAGVPPEAWPSLGFTFSTPTRRFDVPFELVRVFEQCDAGARDAALESARTAGAQALLVGRRGQAIYFRRLDPLENEALSAFEQGLCFGDVCELLAQRHLEVGAAGIVAQLRRWLVAGVFRRASPQRD
jgi:hypothetical protein